MTGISGGKQARSGRNMGRRVAWGLVWAFGLCGAPGLATAGERGTPAALNAAAGGFAFGYVTDGDDTAGPFLLDTQTGRLWRYEKTKLKNKELALVPVPFVGEAGTTSPLPDGNPAAREAIPGGAGDEP
ncbi:MAG: hypothetical protein HZA24_05725 [Nitrospirae bacterium]|nr:hypothetical protein [Nitrospirota bacterium]